MIEKILVAYDSSPASNRALSLAAAMAEKFAADLTILYVIRDFQLPPEVKRMVEVEKIRGDTVEILHVVAESALKEAKHRAETRD